MTFIELMVVIAILGISLTIITVNFANAIRRYRLESYIQGLAAAIKNSQTQAMSEGRRVVIAVVKKGSTAKDLDGNGTMEHYITFVDTNINGRYDAGDLSLERGNWGNVTVGTNTLPFDYGAGADARYFFFLPQGLARMANDGVIEIKYNDKLGHRMRIISMLGAVETEKIR